MYALVTLAIPFWVPLLKRATGDGGVRSVFSVCAVNAILAWPFFMALVAFLLFNVPAVGWTWLAITVARFWQFHRLSSRDPIGCRCAGAAASAGEESLKADATGAAASPSEPKQTGGHSRQTTGTTGPELGRVLLVGNGPSLKVCGKGKEIDAFDTVVRFNSFVTRGMEQHTGSKTTLWCHMMQWYHTGNEASERGEVRAAPRRTHPPPLPSCPRPSAPPEASAEA